MSTVVSPRPTALYMHTVAMPFVFTLKTRPFTLDRGSPFMSRTIDFDSSVRLQSSLHMFSLPWPLSHGGRGQPRGKTL